MTNKKDYADETDYCEATNVPLEILMNATNKFIIKIVPRSKVILLLANMFIFHLYKDSDLEAQSSLHQYVMCNWILR